MLSTAIRLDPKQTASGNDRGLKIETYMADMREMVRKVQQDIERLQEDKAFIRKGILQNLCHIQTRQTRSIRNIVAHGGDVRFDIDLCCNGESVL